MNDCFLEAVGVETVEQAMKDSLKSALGVRRGSKIYKRAELKGERKRFRAEFAKVIIEESRPYIDAEKTVPDIQHREAINRISQKLSSAFSDCLCDEHLRHGIAQKAFNLYLKYLWRLGIIVVPPPHCPIDRVVLTAAGIDGLWTKADDEGQYMEWIEVLKSKAEAESLSLAEWENEVWLKWLLGQKQKRPKRSMCLPQECQRTPAG